MAVCHDNLYVIKLFRHHTPIINSHRLGQIGVGIGGVLCPGTRLFGCLNYVYTTSERELYLLIYDRSLSFKHVRTFPDIIVNVTFAGTDIIVITPSKFEVLSWDGELKGTFSTEFTLKTVLSIPEGYVLLTTTGVYTLSKGQYSHIGEGDDVIVFQCWIVVFTKSECLEIRFHDFDGRRIQTIVRDHSFEVGTISVDHQHGHVVFGDGPTRYTMRWNVLALN